MKRREFLKLGATGLIAFALGYHSHALAIDRSAKEVGGKTFVEIHDLDPWNYNQGYVERLDDLLDRIGVNKREYFLIPANRDDVDALKHAPRFVEYVRQRILGRYVLGHHGLIHWPMDEERWIFEFTNLNREEAEQKCQKAMKIHKEVFGLPPDGGEAPPNWSYSAEALKTFLEHYPYVSAYKVVFPREKTPLIAQAFAPTFQIKAAENALAKFEGEVEHYKPANLRVVFHPQDTASKYFEEVAYRVINAIEAKGYELSAYKKIFA